jgi:hypothetical protein
MNVKKVLLVLVFLLASVFLSQTLQADNIKGYIIPEYYFVVSQNSADEEGSVEGHHGFWIRRIYFSYNTKISDKFSARVRLEMDSPAFEEDKLIPFIKDAWLKYKLGGGANLVVGIMEPPSFNKIEKFWGYRHLEKTAPDLFKLASSRDFGIALDGKTKGGLVYTLMYGNYSSNKSEDNKGKGVYGRLGYTSKSVYAEANAHFSNDGSKDYLYLTGFAGLKGKFGNVGLAFHHKNQSPDEGDDEDTQVLSAMGIFKLSKKAKAVFRFDYFLKENLKDIGGYLPVPSAVAPARLLIAALDFKVHKMIQITPNVKFVFYGDPDAGIDKPGSDFYINLTAKIKFQSDFNK